MIRVSGWVGLLLIVASNELLGMNTELQTITIENKPPNSSDYLQNLGDSTIKNMTHYLSSHSVDDLKTFVQKLGPQKLANCLDKNDSQGWYPLHNAVTNATNKDDTTLLRALLDHLLPQTQKLDPQHQEIYNKILAALARTISNIEEVRERKKKKPKRKGGRRFTFKFSSVQVKYTPLALALRDWGKDAEIVKYLKEVENRLTEPTSSSALLKYCCCGQKK